MIRKVLTATALLLAVGTAQAAAQCAYQGTSYPPGDILCFDTWLQECTRAGHWQSIGACKSTDPMRTLAEAPKPAEALMFTLLDRHRGAMRGTETQIR